jgi:CarD family transcriptional regulator
MEALNIGDKAVYPAQGVGCVVEIESREIAGTPTQFYILEIVDSGLKIMIPTDKADAVGLRQLVTENQISEIFQILSSPSGKKPSTTWNRRQREYMDKIRKGDPLELAEVMRDLYNLKSAKDLSFGEKKIL